MHAANRETGSFVVREVVGRFEAFGDLQNAIQSLQMTGFDRADISMATGADELRENDRPDRRFALSDQPDGPVFRLGRPYFIGAAAAGFTVLIYGGSIPLMALCAFVGGIVGSIVSRTLGRRRARRIEEQLEAGGSVLRVRIEDAAQEAMAETILSEAGAANVHERTIEARRGPGPMPPDEIDRDPMLERVSRRRGA